MGLDFGLGGLFSSAVDHDDLSQYAAVIPAALNADGDNALVFAAKLEGKEGIYSGEYIEVPAEVIESYRGANQISVAQIGDNQFENYQLSAINQAVGLMRASNLSGFDMGGYDLESIFNGGLTAQQATDFLENSDFIAAFAKMRADAHSGIIPHDANDSEALATAMGALSKLGQIDAAYSQLIFTRDLPGMVSDFESSLTDGRAAEAGITEPQIAEIEQGLAGKLDGIAAKIPVQP